MCAAIRASVCVNKTMQVCLDRLDQPPQPPILVRVVQAVQAIQQCIPHTSRGARMTSDTPRLVIFRGGFSADWTVVSALLTLEAKGATFELLDNGLIRVRPPGLLDDASRMFLREHRAEVRRILAYEAPRCREG